MLILLVVLIFTVSGEAAENADTVKSNSTTSQQPTRFSFSSASFTEVVPVEGVNADELYFRAREWFSRAFRSSNNVLQMDSKERMTLIGKVRLKFRRAVLSDLQKMQKVLYALLWQYISKMVATNMRLQMLVMKHHLLE